MHQVNRSALVSYSAEQMYKLVADVKSYPEFLSWCSGSSVYGEHGDEMVASIEVSFRRIKESFSTRNVMTPFESIRMELVDGPFSSLDGEWLFSELDRDGCKIEFSLSFNVSNPFKKRILEPVFSYIANQQIEAFYRRAKIVYG